jgi:hypothetical protein
MHTELCVGALEVLANGMRRDEQQRGDFPVGFSSCNPTQDLLFPLGQETVARSVRPAKLEALSNRDQKRPQ